MFYTIPHKENAEIINVELIKMVNYDIAIFQPLNLKIWFEICGNFLYDKFTIRIIRRKHVWIITIFTSKLFIN
jgi:hypothetical protein